MSTSKCSRIACPKDLFINAIEITLTITGAIWDESTKHMEKKG